jgi:molecular chaperone DnaJ
MTYYDKLGIKSTASSDDIKNAFRQLAQKYHPDRNPGNDAALKIFKDINEAHQVLSDPKKRNEYDLRLLSETRIPNIDELFNVVTNRNRRNPYATGSGSIICGETIEVNVNITVEESIKGCKKPIHIKSQKLILCSNCNGIGNEFGSMFIICPTCSGHGKNIDGHFRMELKKCPTCRGSGKIPVNKCHICKGSGSLKFERDVVIAIPSGIPDGMKLRLAGMGTPGSPPGDLYVTIKIIQDHKNGWKRKNDDLIIIHNIDLSHAVIGGPATIELPDNRSIEINIPPGTQPGSEIVLKGEGVKAIIGTSKGDMRVIINVDLPKKLSPRARKLFDEFIEETNKTS